MIRPFAVSLCIALSLPATGCTSDTTAYPSLARRATEARGFAEPKVVVLVARPDPALDAAIAGVLARMRPVVAGFARDAAVAERAGRAARGRAVGSEAWLGAQSALAELDGWRAQLSTLSGEADELAVAHAATGEADYPALAAAQATIRAEAEQVTATINGLAALTPAA